MKLRFSDFMTTAQDGGKVVSLTHRLPLPPGNTPFCVFLRKGRLHINRRAASVQSPTGSRGVCISGSNAGYSMFRGSVKSTGYPLHSPVSPSLPFNGSNAGYTMFRGSVKSTGYPLHSPVSPSLPLPRVTVNHHIFNWTLHIYCVYEECPARNVRELSTS